MSRITIEIDPDINALGFPRERPAEPYPREYVTLTLPLSSQHVGSLSVPAHMTEREWDTMLKGLTVMRPGLVNDS